MKKKVLTIALAVAVVAILLTGASLAYFTGTDTETNTFTVGNVSIDLIEKQVNEAGTALEAFEQGQTLMPIVGSAQGEKDDFGQPIAENYVDKIVTIKNTGASAAYVRAYFAIPSYLDDGYETFAAGENLLHFNFGNNEGVSTYGVEWDWMTDEGKWNYFETTIDGIKYNVYFADYYQPLAAGETTEQFVSGVYLDARITGFTKKDNVNYIIKGDKLIELDFDMAANGVSCPVFAVAVQADGFENADAAVTAAFGAQYNPWGGAVTNWQ